MSFDHERIATEVKARFGRLFQERVNASAAERDRNHETFSVDMLREMADLGLIGFTAPTAIGGGGRTWEEWGHALEEIGYLCDDSGLPMLLSYRETATNLIYRSGCQGREHLVRRYAEPAVRGEAFIGWLFTEDTDLLKLETSVRRQGDRFVLNGRKCASTGGETCTAWIVYASTDGGSDTMVFVVERSDPGVEVRPLPSMGLRSIGLAEVRFDEVALPEDRILAATDGLSHAQLFVNERRITGSAWLLGRIRSLIEKVIDDTAAKRRFGRALIDLDTFHAQIGQMQIALETARSAAYRVLAQTRAGIDPLHNPLVAIAKYLSTECALKAAHIAQRLSGGHGYFEQYGIERYLRDFYGLVPILGGQPAIETQVGSNVIWLRQRSRTSSPETLPVTPS